MGERKVLVKYYPPDFDPKYLKKNTRSADKQDNVRMMMPFTCRCNICGNYAGIGTKFNMRKETCLDETYLGIRIYRFYFKCSVCKSEISFKTDPKNHDYIVEHNATRNYDPQRDQQAAEEVLKQMRENDEEGNAMAFLENRTNDSKREIEINDALEEIRHLNKRQTKITADQILKQLFLFEVDDDNNNAENNLGYTSNEKGSDKQDLEQFQKEQMQLEYVKDRMKIKRIRPLGDDLQKNNSDDENDNDDSIIDKRIKEQYLGGGDGFGAILPNNKSKENNHKKKSILPIVKKKQVIEGDDKINIADKNKDLTVINSKTNNNKPEDKKQQISALCDYSDSD